MLTERQLFFQYLAPTSEFPLSLEVERAEGLYLYAPDGKSYMDLISGIAVSNVGHRHPKVVETIKNQVDKHLHLMVYGEYVQAPQVKLAEALISTISAPNEAADSYQVYFTSSGAEAVEGAMKLAKRYTNRTEFISCINAYHGSTQGALSLSGAEFFKQNFRPLLPGVRNIRHGVMDDLEQITTRTAAVVIEVLAGEAGVRVPTKAYLQALRERCNQTESLLIFDEIQTGFGRTGTFWAFQDYDVMPDVFVCAKGMGGGMPIGAFIAKREMMRVFTQNPILGHITTFGGHPVSCAASLATFQVIFEEQLLVQVPEKEVLFRKILVHPSIKEVRGKGLMLAVEFESFEVLKPIIDRAIQKGVITDWFLFCDNSMRIAPPLTITLQEIETACGVILESI